MKNKVKTLIKSHFGVSVLLAGYVGFFLMFHIIGVNNNVSTKEGMRMALQPSIDKALAVMVLAIIMAVTEFYYLHKKTESDLYQSLPITRKQMYLTKVKDSLLLFFLADIVLFAGRLLMMIFLMPTFSVLQNIAASFITELLIFMAVFMITVTAMILTGSSVIGVLGTLVFMSWSFWVYLTVHSLCELFFSSYSTVSNFVQHIFYYTSIIATGALMVAGNGGNEIWMWQEHTIQFIVLIFWIIGLFWLNLKLYQIRPAETAGNAMAFPKVNSVFRILMAVPFALITGIYLYDMLNHPGIWILFLVSGAAVVFFHGLIEMQFESRISAFLSKKKELALTVLLVVCVLGSFAIDIFGYDSYHPDSEKIASVEIQTDMLSSAQEQTEDTSENIVLKDDEKDQLIALINEEQNVSSDNEQSATITFHQKNGREKIRNYSLTDEAYDQVNELALKDPETPKILYSIYKAADDKVKDLSFIQYNWVKSLDLSDEEKIKFLKNYREELSNLTYQEMTTAIPIGVFSYTYRKNSSSDDDSDYQYYVYPSFKKTIAFLEDKGCTMIYDLKDSTITQLEISSSETDMSDIKITNQKLIESVKDSLYVDELVPSYYYNYQEMSSKMGYFITADGYFSGEKDTVYINTDQKTLEKLINQ